MNDPTKYDDVIDSRDVIEAVTDILMAFDVDDRLTMSAPDDATDEELALVKLDREGADMFGAEWDHGVTLVRDTYFREYAQELAEDLGRIPSTYSWPASHIDWEGAAEALLQDYSPVYFDGVQYWGRA